MNILFECSAYYPKKGGAESLIEDLADIFLHQGHNVTVITQKHPKYLPAFENKNGVDIIRLTYLPTTITPLWKLPLRLWRYLFLPFTLLKIRNIIKNKGIETVCIGLFGAGSFYIVLLKKLMPFRLTIYVHGSEIREFIRTSGLIRWSMKQGLKESNKIIAVSNDLKKEAAAFAPQAEDKITVIHNGVQLEKIKKSRAYSYKRDYVLFIGRLIPLKGVEILLEAFKKIAPEITGLDLFIIGSGEREQKLKKMSLNYGLGGRVIFWSLQNREMIFSFLKGCKFLVLPSYSEGCPIVVIEALAAGKMVIGSRIKGISEIIEGKKTGALFTPGNSGELAEAIRAYYPDKKARSEIEANIQNLKIEEKYDIKKLASLHLKTYLGPEASC